MAASNFFGDLSGRIALITVGASSGIGAATAVEFSRQGIRLALHGRNITRLNNTKQLCLQQGLKEEDVLLVTGDAGNPEDMRNMIKAVLDKFNTVHILVNNAGYAVANQLEDITSEEMDLVYQLHVKTPLLLSQLLWKELINNKGSIVNVSSVYGMMGVPGCAAYGIAKAGLISLTHALNAELAGKGVRVNCICPGFVKTAAIRVVSEEESVKMFAHLGQQNSLVGRAGEPEEIARTILFLASDAVPYMIGQSVVVDGGLMDARLVSKPQP